MPELSLTPLLQGFALGAGLIIAIGAQNAFVLRQGLKRNHLFLVALICTLCDMTLIALGVGGLGTLIAQNVILTTMATWGGAAFLLYYGLRSFRSAATPESLNVEASATPSTSLRHIGLATLAVSLLNPHVYLDTVVLVGSVGAQYLPRERLSFALGAMLASTTWFFSLAYGAAQLAPLFRRPVTWRMLDVLVGGVMWAVAASLIWSAVHSAGARLLISFVLPLENPSVMMYIHQK